MLSNKCKITRFTLEFIFLQIFMYFFVRLFELLIIILADSNNIRDGIDLNLFIAFSSTSFIISIIFTLICLKWEYSIRESLKIQAENELKREIRKLDAIIIEIEKKNNNPEIMD